MRSLFFNATVYDETLCWELNNNLQVDDMFCGSLAGFNDSCVRLIGLVDKTLTDCNKFADDPDDGSDSSSFRLRLQESSTGIFLFGATLLQMVLF